jgi:hypothetical protein
VNAFREAEQAVRSGDGGYSTVTDFARFLG